MQYGNFTYNICYIHQTGKVCITCTDSDPIFIEYYNRGDLETYAKWFRGINPIYEEALSYFPRGDQQDEDKFRQAHPTQEHDTTATQEEPVPE